MIKLKEKSAQNKKGKKKKKWLWVVLIFLLAGAGILFFFYRRQASAASASVKTTEKTAIAEKRSISSALSSSGVIAPKDTYDITSLVEGEVVAADFEEGDQVSSGQVLYQIDTSTLETELTSASNSLTRAKNSYDTSAKEYSEAKSAYSGNSYKATEAGYIKTLYIKSGDKISSGTKIADLYDDKTMKLKIPFLSTDVAAIGTGSDCIVTLTDTLEQIPGVVTNVSNMEETLSGGRMVRYVTIQVTNPGGLTTSHTATAAVGETACAMEGNFEPMVESVMSADLPSSVDIETLLVSEGDYIAKGSPVFRIENSSAEKMLRSYKDSLDKAAESLESAQNKVDTTNDSYENYTITAPISGQVITKSVKTGDKISKSSSGATALAVIYDLSAYTFEMSVDELDVSSVQVGQKVEVTADAVENKTFTGTVTNVSLQSSNSNGVTNYPVTVTMDEASELLPGMNVDGTIILEQAEDALTIPVDSLMRGDRVYVKDDTVKEAQGTVPAGFRSVEVKTGLINDDYVEITEGLNEGDEVYVAESSKQSTTMEMMPSGMPSGGFSGGGAPGGGSGGNRGSGGNGGAQGAPR